MINYPTGVMMNFHRPKLSHHKYRKYRNHKIKFNGHKFDSKAEFQYYLLLKNEHKKFKCHPLMTVWEHENYIFRGKKYSIIKHSYKPDFVIYDDKGIAEVDDIKGISDKKGNSTLSYDHYRMDDFSREWHIPVTIVRKKHGHFVKKQR